MSIAPSRRAKAAMPEDAVEQASRRRKVPAWVMSGAVHFVALILLAVFVRTAPRGADVEPDRSGGISLVKTNQGKTEYLSETDVESSTSAKQATAANPTETQPLPTPDALPFEVAGALPSPDDLKGLAGDLGATLPDALGLTSGVGPSKTLGGQTQTEVFGLRGVGSKFLYVFDRSGSMSAYDAAPLRAAKAQLIASLDSLKSTDQFQIIFYNERPSVFNPFPGKQPEMMFGTEENKRLAKGFVQSIVATGATRHMPALQIAMKLQPDVLFFLTDAEEPRLTDDDLRQVQRWNGGTSINAIEFGPRPYTGESNFLTRLAKENNGQYAYRNVTTLMVDRP